MADLFAVIAAIGSIIAVFLTYREKQFSHKVAEAKGVFKRHNVSISLYDDSNVDNIFWAIPLQDDGLIKVPFNYCVTNNGEKSAKDLELNIQMSNELHGSNLFSYEFKGDALRDAKSKFVKVSDYTDLVIISKDTLVPGEHIDVDDSVLLAMSTKVKGNINAKSKDDVDFSINYEFDMPYIIDFVLMAADTKPISRRITINVIDTSTVSVQNYFKKINKKIKIDIDNYNRTYANRMKYYFGPINKPPIKFIIICCKSSDLIKDDTYPLYETKQYFEIVGYEFVKWGGYAIPSLGIWPDSRESITWQKIISMIAQNGFRLK